MKNLSKCQEMMTIQQKTYHFPFDLNYYKLIGIQIQTRQTNAYIPQ